MKVPASERTEVRLATDGKYLYIGARMYDREPHLIVPGEKIRDVQLSNSDHIALIFDTYHDRQNGFVFATTPAGVEYDGQVIREGEGGGASVAGQNRMQAGAMGGFNVNWDASWTVATSIDSLGWTAEFRIPFSTLRFQAGSEDQTWGLNVSRSIRRKNEELYWAFIPRQFNLYRLSLAGTLTSLDVPSRRIQTITPYILSSVQQRWAGDVKTQKTPTEFGGEIKYGVTPSLTLDLTYNTDFAQVEVDDQRVNLTRFPVFFPEKRPFSSRMPACSRLVRRRPWTCSSRAASALPPMGLRSPSSVVDVCRDAWGRRLLVCCRWSPRHRTTACPASRTPWRALHVSCRRVHVLV